VRFALRASDAFAVATGPPRFFRLREPGLIRTLVAFVLAVCLASCGQGQGLAIEDAQFRPPLGSTGIGVGYFTIRSAKADRIVSITSPEADSIEIHASVTEGGNVSMQRLEGVDLPAGQTVRFESNGMHLMVFSPRISGEALTFPITIELQSGAKQTAPFKVITGGADHHG
jgi:copper(I)-binding protein